ncbi:MAG: hypothetical protein M3P49_08430 [Actinomycetota bacterium]|nr:hypothetical protein [Actinomycetota bacterium]
MKFTDKDVLHARARYSPSASGGLLKLTSAATVVRKRRGFSEEGLEVALMPKKLGRHRRHVLEAAPRRTW